MMFRINPGRITWRVDWLLDVGNGWISMRCLPLWAPPTWWELRTHRMGSLVHRCDWSMINVVKARNLAGISLVSTYLGGHQVHNKGTQSQSSGSKCCWVARATHSYTIISTSRNKNPRVQFLFSLRGPLWTWVNSWYYSANWISFVQQFLFPSIGGD